MRIRVGMRGIAGGAIPSPKGGDRRFCVKGLVLILAAFGTATMWEAVFADVGVSVIAILNAMRALKTTHIE